jgi:uncharacterized protein YjbJ (UPF0337 family)
MTEHNKADQARKGLIDSVKGKAKEVFGAVTGNESLTAEGQLEQTQAAQRKEANSVEAVADAEAEEARREAAEVIQAGASERADVAKEAAAVENAVRIRQAAEKQAAENAGNHELVEKTRNASVDALTEVQQAKAEAREEIADATEDFVEAADDHRSEVQKAADTREAAERAREHAAALTAEADLP